MATRYFLKAEDYDDSGQTMDKRIHTKGGPLPVSAFQASNPAIQVLANGLKELGVEPAADLNNGRSLGFGYADSTTKKGLPASTCKAYGSIANGKSNFFYTRKVLVRQCYSRREQVRKEQLASRLQRQTVAIYETKKK